MISRLRSHTLGSTCLRFRHHLCATLHADRDFILSALASVCNISLQNSDDVVKHKSADSFSRSGIGYMRALEVLARKHDLFHSDTQVLVKEYLVLRSLLHSFAGLKLSEFAGIFESFGVLPL